MSEFISFLFQIFTSGLLAFVALLFTEPKKQRIVEYNQRIEELLKTLNEINGISIVYWSSNSSALNEKQLAQEILSRRTECYRLSGLIRNKNYRVCLSNDINRYLCDYLKIITGGEFQNNSRNSDIIRLDEADKVLTNLRSCVDASKITFTIRNFIFVKI